MTQIDDQTLSGVAETLLLPLYVRALETQRPDALLEDEKALAFYTQHKPAFANAIKVKMDADDMTGIVLRNREFDRRARDFLAQHPKAVVVQLGCGLDGRFERLDDGLVEWYDLDLPEVIALRRMSFREAGGRYHYLPYSAFDPVWLNMLNVQDGAQVLFLAEGVFMYFEEEQIKALVLRLRERFPGAELVCDAFSPYLVTMNNLRFKISRSNIAVHYGWGLKDGRDLEKWGAGITLLDEWRLFDKPEPRLAHLRWMRRIPFLAKALGIFHYRLGQSKT